MAHGKQDQLYAPLETDDHPWLQDPSVSHVFAAQAPLVTHVQVGSVTAMACFANGGMTDLASGDEHGTVALWRVL